MMKMKNRYKFLLFASASAFFISCADDSKLEFPVEKPQSIAQMEYLNEYDTLKSYVDRTANPNFKLGAGVSISDFTTTGVMNRLIQSNFDEVTAGYEMKHGAVVKDDGTMNFDNVTAFLANTQKVGVSVYGHTLCWHANQNAKYLNSIIAPTIVPGAGSPRWEVVTEQNFESADASNYTYNANAVTSFTANGEGKDGLGRALKINNASVRTNDWDCQLFINFPRATETGQKWRISMDIKSDVNASYPTQAHATPGAYKHWDFFGTLSATPTWVTYTKEVTISSSQTACKTVAFNLGKNATNYYFDNVKIEFFNEKPSGGTVDKTAEEKRVIIDNALDKWISAMLGASKAYVKAWDVVNEPMSDWPDPTKLKTGVGKTLAADEFYWQDYLGKDYAVRAIQLARQYGNASDILFVNDYGLEGADQKKCLGLIDYVKYIETKGVKVDGIGTQMHVTLGETTIEGIRAMFTNLAATGKLIKVSELDMGIKPAGSTASLKTADVTNEQQKQMGDFYQQIVRAYFELIPAAQRYGITQWATTDSPSGSSWRAGEPIGLWTLDFNRKHTFAGFANGLAGKTVVAP